MGDVGIPLLSSSMLIAVCYSFVITDLKRVWMRFSTRKDVADEKKVELLCSLVIDTQLTVPSIVVQSTTPRGTGEYSKTPVLILSLSHNEDYVLP